MLRGYQTEMRQNSDLYGCSCSWREFWFRCRGGHKGTSGLNKEKISYCIHPWVRDPKWRSSTKGHRGADAFEPPSSFRVWRLNSFLLIEPEVQELSPFISAMIERSDPLVMAQFSKLIPQCVKRRRRVPALKNKNIFLLLCRLWHVGANLLC